MPQEPVANISQQDRRHERHELQQPLSVLNLHDEQSLGALVNITIEGLMLIANKPIECNRIYQIKLVLPNPIGDHDAIELGVDCLWSRGEEQYQRYWAGFQIIDASQSSIKIIESLIRDYGHFSE
jgi:hypothetical protein